jgi:DNA-binding GntR family transcriptional regulator
VYNAWVPEAEQRATGTLAGRMPTPPPHIELTPAQPAPSRAAADDDAAPYRRIAADLRAAIACGALGPGDQLPTVADLAARYGVGVATAHRAVADLSADGQVQVSRGKRAIVAST